MQLRRNLSVCVRALGLLGLTSLVSSSAFAAAPKAEEIDLNALAKYANIPKSQLEVAITEATYQQKIIDTMTRPYEGKPWHMYQKLFITDQRIEEGIAFYLKNEATLERAAKQLGVAPEIICSIIGVETYYGKNMGSWRVLDALYTLGFHYPPRSAYFSKEFANYVKLANREMWNITEIKGSYAGAMGMGQFMPSSYLNYAIDFDNDQHVNLFNNVEDAIGSVANYFKAHGWINGSGVMYLAHINSNGKQVSEATLKKLMAKEWNLTPRELTQAGITTKVNLSQDQKVRLYAYDLANGTKEYVVALNNFNAITKYNKSPLYARAVFELSEAIALGYKEAKLLQGQYVAPEGRRP